MGFILNKSTCIRKRNILCIFHFVYFFFSLPSWTLSRIGLVFLATVCTFDQTVACHFSVVRAFLTTPFTNWTSSIFVLMMSKHLTLKTSQRVRNVYLYADLFVPYFKLLRNGRFIESENVCIGMDGFIILFNGDSPRIYNSLTSKI